MLANAAIKPRTSPIWQLFKRGSPGLAKCCICRKTLSYKSSISNLKRHLIIKHGGVFEEMLEQHTYVPKASCPDTVEKSLEDFHRRKETSVTSLISLVGMHPCLWDSRCESYGIAELQHNAWNSIASRLCPTEDQSEAVTRLSEQFNGLRNVFFSKRHGSYHQQLSFMTPLLEENSEKNSIGTELSEMDIKQEILDESNEVGSDSQEEENHNEEYFKKGNGNDNILLKKGGSSKENLPQATEKIPNSYHVSAAAQIKCTLQLNNVDDDSLFLLSLVDEIKTVRRQLQVNFKAELLSAFSKLVKKYENKL